MVGKRVKGISGQTIYKTNKDFLSVTAPGIIVTQKKVDKVILHKVTNLKQDISVTSNISFDTSLMDVSQVVERGKELLSGLSFVCRQERGVHSVNCNFTINGQRDTETRKYRKSNNQLLSVRGFEVVRQPQSTLFLNSERHKFKKNV